MVSRPGPHTPNNMVKRLIKSLRAWGPASPTHNDVLKDLNSIICREKYLQIANHDQLL